MFANYFVMYILFFSVTKFFQYNSSINYFCSCTIGTLLNIAKLHVSKYLQSCHITINKFHSQWEPHNLFTLEVVCLLTTFSAAFLVVCSILQWKMSQSDSLHVRIGMIPKFFYVKPTATFDWMSFWYSGDMFWFLWQPESV